MMQGLYKRPVEACAQSNMSANQRPIIPSAMEQHHLPVTENRSSSQSNVSPNHPIASRISPIQETWRQKTSPLEQKAIDSFSQMLDQFTTDLDDEDEEEEYMMEEEEEEEEDVMDEEISVNNNNKTKVRNHQVDTWRKRTSVQEQSAIDSLSLMLEEFSKDISPTPPMTPSDDKLSNDMSLISSMKPSDHEFSKDMSLCSPTIMSDDENIISCNSNARVKMDTSKNNDIKNQDISSMTNICNSISNDSSASDKIKSNTISSSVTSVDLNETWRRQTSPQEQNVIDSFSEMLDEFEDEYEDEDIVPYDELNDENNSGYELNDQNVENEEDKSYLQGPDNQCSKGDRSLLLLYDNGGYGELDVSERMLSNDQYKKADGISVAALESEAPYLSELLDNIDKHADMFTPKVNVKGANSTQKKEKKRSKKVQKAPPGMLKHNSTKQINNIVRETMPPSLNQDNSRHRGMKASFSVTDDKTHHISREMIYNRREEILNHKLPTKPKDDIQYRGLTNSDEVLIHHTNYNQMNNKYNIQNLVEHRTKNLSETANPFTATQYAPGLSKVDQYKIHRLETEQAVKQQQQQYHHHHQEQQQEQQKHQPVEGHNNFVAGSRQLRSSTGQLRHNGDCKGKSKYILEVYRTTTNGGTEMCLNNNSSNKSNKIHNKSSRCEIERNHKLVYTTLREVTHQR